MATHFLRSALGGMVALMAVSAGPLAAHAGLLDCLQHFNCQLQGPCPLPCSSDATTQQAATPVAEPAPAPQQTVTTGRSDAVATDKPARHKVARKTALTIFAHDGEVDQLKALAKAMPDQPLKIIEGTSETADKPTDLAVVTSPEAATSAPEAKIFIEQLHVIAGDKIDNIGSLAGKVVSFGPEGSADQEAARRAFAAFGVSVQETPLDLANALDGVATGDVDAVVVLAPAPFDKLKTLRRSNLHLLPLPDNVSLPAGMVDAEITPKDYPGLVKTAPIKVAGVEATLSVNARSPNEPRAKRFFASLVQHSAVLSRHGFDLLKPNAAHDGTSDVASGKP